MSVARFSRRYLRLSTLGGPSGPCSDAQALSAALVLARSIIDPDARIPRSALRRAARRHPSSYRAAAFPPRMYLRPPRESGAAPDAAVAPSSARPTRFDPFLAPAALAGRSSPSSEESAETELSELARAHDWFEEANGRGRHEVSRRGPRGTEGVRNPWAEYANAALNLYVLLHRPFVTRLIHPPLRGPRSDALVSAEWTERAGPTVSKQGRIPQRVLDVGCGVAAEWILTTAQLAGWERTQFVGLDLAPVLVPRSMLPPAVANRTTFMQHDAIKALPLRDGEFDLIRCAGMTVGIPGEFTSVPLPVHLF